jgi:hypothetical protein
MAVPRQMTAHSLDAKKGWPSPHAVDFDATFKASASDTDNGLHTDKPAFAGSLVSLDASGNFVFGVADAAMPMWLFQNSDDPDVTNDGGTLLADPATTDGTYGAWAAVAPTGKLMALVAVGAYELNTTEFTGTSFAPNDPLMADSAAENGQHANRGKVDEYAWAQSDGSEPDVVGIVSRAEAKNSHGVLEVSFWPVYLPTSKLINNGAA